MSQGKRRLPRVGGLSLCLVVAVLASRPNCERERNFIQQILGAEKAIAGSSQQFLQNGDHGALQPASYSAKGSPAGADLHMLLSPQGDPPHSQSPADTHHI
jgi:hypothetical protein